jgi:hypothetical protein
MTWTCSLRCHRFSGHFGIDTYFGIQGVIIEASFFWITVSAFLLRHGSGQ